MKVRILKKDGTSITDQDSVGFVNLPHASLFKQCEIQMQHVNVETLKWICLYRSFKYIS